MQERKQVFGTAIEASWHHFINLTKQPQNIPDELEFPKNWTQGVSICTDRDLWRIDSLRLKKAKTKVISFEPLYSDLGEPDLEGIDWVIIGAQTHPLIRPKNKWIEQIVNCAGALGIPVFIKNNITGWNFKEVPEMLKGAKPT